MKNQKKEKKQRKRCRSILAGTGYLCCRAMRHYGPHRLRSGLSWGHK